MTDGFEGLELRTWYRASDDRVNDFYVPVLSRARTYDRLVGYWRSSSLVVAAAGIAEFARRQGTMRIIAGAELTEDDIRAIRDGRPLEDALAQRIIEAPDEAGDIIADHRHEVLAWLLAEGRLEIRIGVPVDDGGLPLVPSEAGRLFHSKYGILEDDFGRQIVFAGSTNESAAGWRTNHESFAVYRSWRSHETWVEYAFPVIQDFAQHWDDGGVAGWRVIPFPDEAADHLLARAPADTAWVPPPDPQAADLDQAQSELRQIANAPRLEGGTGVGFATTAIKPWPHQESIAGRVLETWPRSYLFADEVGLGKTIEAGLVLRELLLSGKAERILLLVPPSVQRQWQEELWEKFLLDVPSYEGGRFYNADRSERRPAAGASPWSAFPIVLASSFLARRRDQRQKVLTAGPWDLVLVDEAHHARRRGAAGDSANQLLQLLRAMRDHGSWRALLLATATPMQMRTADLYDLLDLFGLPGRWASGEDTFERYYRHLAEPDPMGRDWNLLQSLLHDHLTAPGVEPHPAAVRDVAQLPAPAARRVTRFDRDASSPASIAGRSSEERAALDRWLRSNTPLRDRVFRTSREALREYQRQGILDASAVIPTRRVRDEMIDLDPVAEQPLYDRIESYIGRYYAKYMDGDKKPLGFIMTVYRRRLTSSFHAVHQSLSRRLQALETGRAELLLDADDKAALEDTHEPEELDAIIADLTDEIVELRSFVAELDPAVHADTKVHRLKEDIRAALAAGHRTVLIFTQFTDTMDWLRDELRAEYGDRVACYSGRGGERWSSTEQRWVAKSKAEIKDLFRSAEVRVLLGTDAMSEGLNLQTCDRLFNYDMPWNFTRVEQRIGRVDRINGQPVVTITNYFYRGTVEEQVYTGIAEDADWFQQVVGPAQPVLSRVEEAIGHLAMLRPEARDEALRQELEEVRQAIASSSNRPVDLRTMETDEAPPPGGYAAAPAITLPEIARILTSNPLTRSRFHPHPDLPDTWYVEHEGEKVPMTIDIETYDANPEIGFLTYGHPVFTALLNAPTLTSHQSTCANPRTCNQHTNKGATHHGM